MPRRLGKYEIIEEIGSGGFATVHRAHDPTLGRDVAIKVLDPWLMKDPSLVERFRREARAAAGLRHPNIVRIHDISETEGVLAIVMELLPGPSLAGILAGDAPLDVERAVELLRPLAEALDYAHGRGLIHRDVKPSNAILDKAGQPVLTDFGLVKAVEESGSSAVSLTLSRTGMTLGTPAYMAPEQADYTTEAPVDHRADLYGLGVVAYEMLTGQVPFQAETPIRVAMGHLNLEPPSPRELNPALSEAVEAVLLKALAKKPDDRWQSALEMVEALRKGQAGVELIAGSDPERWQVSIVASGAQELQQLGPSTKETRTHASLVEGQGEEWAEDRPEGAVDPERSDLVTGPRWQELEVENVARVRVVGVGGGGSNSIYRLTEDMGGLCGIQFITVGTDAQSLMLSNVRDRVRIGPEVTRGLGASGDPNVGTKAAEESADHLYKMLHGASMVFIVAGMGGGTGTGASPVVARIAREAGAMVVGLVTKPFAFEGARRRELAEEGIKRLTQHTDILIAIPNDCLLAEVDRRGSIQEVFRLADQVFWRSTRVLSDLVSLPTLIPLDLASVRSVMAMGGAAWIAAGSGEGENKALRAAEQALRGPILRVPINGARSILVGVTGGPDMTVHEVENAAEIIRRMANPEARMICGAVIDQAMEDRLRVTALATGFPAQWHSAAFESRRTKEDPYKNLDIPAFLRRSKL